MKIQRLQNTGTGILTIVTERRFVDVQPGEVYTWFKPRDKPLCWFHGKPA